MNDDPLAILFVKTIYESETGSVARDANGNFIATIKRHGRIEQYILTRCELEERAADESINADVRALARHLLATE